MSDSQFLMHQTEDGKTRILVRFEGETVWLTQAEMATLFQRDVSVIGRHIRNIFADGELVQESNVQKMHIASSDKPVAYFNLDVIISVGYRVKSLRGTQFRIWATQRLHEFIIKGFTLDDQRLKEQTTFADYFDELLERIRDIRSSEKVLYRNVRDICRLSVDYDGTSEESRRFFQMVQNKLHHAATGRTAAELITDRADASKPNMGLTSWSGAKVRSKDITVAKNYLSEREITVLNLLVAQYLDYAELQATSQTVMYMKTWLSKLDDILRINDRSILAGPGVVSHEKAEQAVRSEYAQFEARRRTEENLIEDLDDSVKKLGGPKGKD